MKKGVQRITATRDKQAAAKARRQEEEGDPYVEEQLIVQREDGVAVDFATAVEDIQIYLQQHGSEATLDQVRENTGFDLHQPGLLEALRRNPRIETIALAAGERLKYAAPLGVRNRGSLAHMLSRAFPGSGEAEAVGRAELNADETYEGVDVDVDELLAQNQCVRVSRTEKRARDFVLFAPPAGRPLPEEIRELWHAEHLPQGPALQEAVVARKLRSAEEIAEREEQRAGARKRAKDLAAAPKQARVGRIRKWNNTHLGDAEQLEELTKR